KGGHAATTVLITTPPPSLPRDRSRPSLVVSGELLRPTDTTILSRHPDNRQSTQQLWTTTTSHGGTTPESTGMHTPNTFSPPHQRFIHNAPDRAGSHRLRTSPAGETLRPSAIEKPAVAWHSICEVGRRVTGRLGDVSRLPARRPVNAPRPNEWSACAMRTPSTSATMPGPTAAGGCTPSPIPPPRRPTDRRCDGGRTGCSPRPTPPSPSTPRTARTSTPCSTSR